VLITGASAGIGRACADYLHDRGCKVYGASRRIQDSLRFSTLAMDVTDDRSVADGIARVMNAEGRLDVVINNAGFGLAGAIEDTTVEEARSQFETNFFGVVRVCRAVLPVFRKQGSGLIVNMSSLAGFVAIPFQTYYSATKFALEALSEGLRIEVKRFGIRVVLIEPSDFKSDFTANRKSAAAARPDSAYWEQYSRSLTTMEASERSGPSPIIIARLVERIIHDPSPRLRNPVGLWSQRFGVWLKTVLPARLFEYLLTKLYG
jgi:NAD(P)-dependent dehydrogenase (short-subunit alcohol dehydrogenase family)